MRHQLSLRALGRTKSHRRALLRNLVTSLVLKEKITTTVAKAKELRPLVEKYVTLGRVDTVHNRRLADSYMLDGAAVSKLFTDLGPRFKSRSGGYTRIVRSSVRPGDATEMAVIEFVEKGAVNASASTDSAAEKPAKKATAKKAAAKSEDAPKKKTTAKKSTKKSAKEE